MAKNKSMMNRLIEAYKDNKEVLKKARERRYYYGMLEPMELVKMDHAVDVAIKSMSKQIPFQLKNKDEETLTGICKCGRVTGKGPEELYCKYCGQRVYW